MKIKRVAISLMLCILAFMVNTYIVETRIHNNNSKKYCLTNIYELTPSDIDINTIK